MNDVADLYSLSLDPDSYWIIYDINIQNGWAEVDLGLNPYNLYPITCINRSGSSGSSGLSTKFSIFSTKRAIMSISGDHFLSGAGGRMAALVGCYQCHSYYRLSYPK